MLHIGGFLDVKALSETTIMVLTKSILKMEQI